MISNPAVNAAEDFSELARWVHELDSGVLARALPDTPRVESDPSLAALPALTVSPAPLQRFRPARGSVFQGQRLGKSVEYERLESVGVKVPRWALLGPSRQRVDGQAFGPYVVVKPEFGARGADVRIQRGAPLRWTPPKTRQSLELGGTFNPTIIQEFVYTGRWPVSFRVATLFGCALWALRIEASHARRPLLQRDGFDLAGGGISVVSSGRGCTFELLDDPAVIALAEAAHRAFPAIPLLGVDILRDADTGSLVVVEVNSLGYTWHFSSVTGLRVQREFGLHLESQFHGRRRAAALLAAACAEHAR